MIPRRRYNIEAGFFNDALTGRLAPSRMRAFVPRFEAALAASLGGRHSVQATGSGRKALATLLDTLGIPKGSTIMIPAYTLGDIGPFLGRLGYRWITCDVDPGRPVMTAATVLDAWPSGGDVKCVLATHLFGIPADVPAIAKAVEPFHATVIEDCAQAHGARLHGRPVGSFSDIAVFSTMFGKHLSILGSTMGPHADYVTVMQLLFKGRLKAVIGAQYALEDIHAAHRALEAGAYFGKIVLTVG